MDVGQANANARWQQAVAGTFRMERGAAEECAKVFVRLVDMTLDPQIVESRRLHRLDGFGGFDSAQQLQAGFEAKGVSTTEALTGLKEAALRMAAAYLQAGGAFEEADAMNRRAKDATRGTIEQ